MRAAKTHKNAFSAGLRSASLGNLQGPRDSVDGFEGPLRGREEHKNGIKEKGEGGMEEGTCTQRKKRSWRLRLYVYMYICILS